MDGAREGRNISFPKGNISKGVVKLGSSRELKLSRWCEN
jgi:hypothetical protein